MSERQEQFIFTTAQALQEELIRTDLGHEAKPVPAHRIRIIGCPAEDDTDERALFFLDDLLDPLRFDCQIFANAQLAAETITRLGAGEAMVMVIAVLPPGGMARSRSLCKQLRGRFAQLKILVLCWQCSNTDTSTKRRPAGGREEDRAESRQAGFDYHVVKPLEFQRLERILTAAELKT